MFAAALLSDKLFTIDLLRICIKKYPELLFAQARIVHYVTLASINWSLRKHRLITFYHY